MPLGETITVFNKSGKVVKNSKHIVNVWKEAQSAYRERKAEIKAGRKADFEDKKARLPEVVDQRFERRDSSQPSSRASSRDSRSSKDSQTPSRRRHRKERAPVERGYSDSFFTNDDPFSPGSPRAGRGSGLRHELTLDEDGSRAELVRRNTDGMLRERMSSRPKSSRSASMSDIGDIDMNLAYGELPPPLPPRKQDEQMELRNQVTKLQQLLDEGNALQHSATAMIESLQKNPDQLAAVALTLGEISNLASKMAPGALMALKGAFPAVVALLLSPEFLIAAGVGVGVTVIALGGYMIVKKLKKRKADKVGAEPDLQTEFDELQEINSDISRIEMWRRGIADAEGGSVGTSAEGEFVTPRAGKQLVEEGKLRQSDLKSTKSTKVKKTSKSKSESKAKVKKEKKSFQEEEEERASEDAGPTSGQKAIAWTNEAGSSIKSLFNRNMARREKQETEAQKVLL